MEQWVWSYVFFHIKVYRLRKALFVFTFLFFFFRKREINCKINMQNRIPCVEFTTSLWQYLFLQFHTSSVLIGFEKDMIQIHVFLELLFSLDCHFGGFRLKNEAWWDVYFLCCFFENFSLWPIKSADLLDSGIQSKI